MGREGGDVQRNLDFVRQVSLAFLAVGGRKIHIGKNMYSERTGQIAVNSYFSHPPKPLLLLPSSSISFRSVQQTSANDVVCALLKECQRNNQNYARHAVQSVAQVVDAFVTAGDDEPPALASILREKSDFYCDVSAVLAPMALRDIPDGKIANGRDRKAKLKEQ